MIIASCLCGAVKIGVETLPDRVTDCNCSACRRYGTLWAYYHPRDVTFLEGADATEGFARGEKSLAFHHCRVCGCMTHWAAIDPAKADRMAINARLLDPALLAGIGVRKLDGADTWTFLD
jgi:hypothetical protein